MPDIGKSALLMRIKAPMQAWGTGSLFEIRDTQSEPSKSGIFGLLGCACGRKRDDIEFIAKCCQLTMNVLVIKEGKRLWDYHVSGGGTWMNGSYGVASANGKNTGNPVLSRRSYLSDADFIVALIGNDELIDELVKGLNKPIWSIYLGRKAFPPSTPLFLAKTADVDAKKALLNGLLKVIKNEGWLDVEPLIPNKIRGFGCPEWIKKVKNQMEQAVFSHEIPSLRMILECSSGEGNSVEDVPMTFEKINRKYTRRYVRNDYLDVASIMEEIHAGTSLPDKA